MFGVTSVPEQFFIFSKENPSIPVPFSNVTSSLSSCLAVQSLLTSNPEITRFDFSSSAFSALDGTQSWPYSMTTTSLDTVSDSSGRPTARREGYGADLEHQCPDVSRVLFLPLEPAVGNLR